MFFAVFPGPLWGGEVRSKSRGERLQGLADYLPLGLFFPLLLATMVMGQGKNCWRSPSRPFVSPGGERFDLPTVGGDFTHFLLGAPVAVRKGLPSRLFPVPEEEEVEYIGPQGRAPDLPRIDRRRMGWRVSPRVYRNEGAPRIVARPWMRWGPPSAGCCGRQWTMRHGRSLWGVDKKALAGDTRARDLWRGGEKDWPGENDN